jgi:peptide/nickel transport system substrate-binding protein
MNRLAAAFLIFLPFAATAAPMPEDCGTIVTEANNDITSLSPLYASGLGNSIASQLLYQPLVWINRYGQVDYTRSLAAKIDVSPDTTTYTVTLKAWHWSDGVPVTAADVVYSWDMIAKLGTAYPNYGAGGIPMDIKSITALDTMHVQVVLTQKVNPLWFIDNGLSQITPLPAHAWSHFSLNQLYQAQSDPKFFSVVDGPLLIKRLNVGLNAIFVPNPHYDGPKPHFQRFILNFVHSDGAAVQQVEAGELDFAPLPMALYSSVQHLPGLHVEQLSPVSYWYFLNLNMQNPRDAFFRDVRVRDAMQDALNQKAMIDTIYHGYGSEVYTPIPPVDANMLAPQLAEGNYSVGYNPAKARALLTEAGYTPGPDGIMQKNGQKLEFTTLMGVDSAESEEIVLMMQAQLRAVGIKMNARQIAFNQMEALMNNSPQGWDAAELGTSMAGYPSGESMFQTGVGGNQGGYSDAKMDALIAESVDKPGLQGLYDYEIYAAAQQPVIFLATVGHIDLVSNRIHGLDAYSDGGLRIPSALYCTAEGASTTS